ncbi:Exodeoxyribonuclease II family protein [Desulfonema limicola]|uniref:Exodeoxyribonuclease II family protein n=1 Tax=Desulfonema limicola TaxID=45656 RepID=A0A975GIH1_9BACT|nr:ribonuclease catalytic domain-containing protein [Desulfonema limicola]QTA82334.1 Exodeoxyribonuclease II family protein [Desulfonema limicola]
MESGNIVEYIDRQKIICAVVLEIKNQRLRLLNENNREVKLSVNRLSHKSKINLDLSMGREKLAGCLKEKAQFRKQLAAQIQIKELWEILNTEQEWIDLETMTEFCFPNNLEGDYEAAVVRAFFASRIYFKYTQDGFFPYSEEQVNQAGAKAREAEEKNRIIEAGGDWLKKILAGTNNNKDLNKDQKEFVKILKSFYLFEKESPYSDLGKSILANAGIGDSEILFHVFVKLDIWNSNENIDIYRYAVPTEFSEKLTQYTFNISQSCKESFLKENRKDFTSLPIITIDGQSTLDFDDAISLEVKEDHYLLGVHISDVGHFVDKDSPIDKEAIIRGSSIYMPDMKIPMLPPSLAEDRCSLKAGEIRPAISTMIRLSLSGDIMDYEIVPSIIKVSEKLTYYDVNLMAEDNADIIILQKIAQKFRQKRLSDGAVQISLPEVNVWINEDGDLIVNKTNRESPGRMLVSEIMIMANWLMAKFLSENKMPAIFRSQPGPKDRLYKDEDGTLYQNWMQRKLLSRFVLNPESERHSGLGLDEYVTCTSPIRKYFDLITQRQLRSIFGLNAPCKLEEIQKIINALEQPMMYVSRLQNRRKRYWLLKYLETRIGQKEEAIVLKKRRNSYLTLMTEYMVECPLPLSSGISVKPEDLVRVTIQHVNARKDALSVFIS